MSEFDYHFTVTNEAIEKYLTESLHQRIFSIFSPLEITPTYPQHFGRIILVKAALCQGVLFSTSFYDFCFSHLVVVSRVSCIKDATNPQNGG